MGESLAAPRERLAPVSSLRGGQGSALTGSKREERAGCIFPSFSILCLPFSLCRAGLRPPCPLPLASHWVSVCHIFSMSPVHPFCLSPTPLGLGPPSLDVGFQPSLRALPAKHTFQPVPGQPGQSGLIFNQCFCLTQQMLPKAFGRRVLWSRPSRGPWVGAGWRGRALVCRGHS